LSPRLRRGAVGDFATRLWSMSNAFLALIWWVIPAGALIGALGYVLWVTQFKDRYETQTSRSVDQFQRFQGAFSQARVVNESEDSTDDRKRKNYPQRGEGK
jgi:nitrate reductase NapE component